MPLFVSRLRALAALLVATLLLGSGLAAQTLAAEPAKAATDKPAADNPANRRNAVYTLSPGDRVRVVVFQEEDLSALPRIDARGTINLPLVGDVKVGGLVVADAQRAIEAAFREGRFLREPAVTVNVEEYARREIQVLGEVRNPGKFDLPVESTLTLVEAIGRAGGFTDIAKGTEVRLTRIGPDGHEVNTTVDVESIIRGRGKSKVEDNSMVLRPGDIVYVPQRII
jgi:polysaccharide biosynthesis/export protein